MARTVDRKTLQAALAQAQQTQKFAQSGQGFDSRGGAPVALAQIATAGIGAFAQNRAQKQLAELEVQEQQQFAQQFPQFKNLARSTTAPTRQAAIQAQIGGQIKQQFAKPIQKTDQGLVRINSQSGESFPITGQEGGRVGVPGPKEPSFTVKKTDQGLVRINTKTGESFPITSEEGRVGVPEPEAKKPLSAETAKVLTVATGGINALNNLSELLGTDGTVSKRSQFSFEGIKSPKGRQITLLRKDLADSIGRLRSGGAINEEELKTFNSFVPTSFDDPETTQFKMRKLGEKFSTLQAGITGQEIPQAVLKLGGQDPKAAAQAELKRRGLI